MLSSYLIIYRMINGHAWTTDTWNPKHAESFRFKSTAYGQSDTRVAHPTSDGPYRLNPIDEKDADDAAKMSGIQSLQKTKANSEHGSWKSGKEEA